jgi:hypothetical protein
VVGCWEKPEHREARDLPCSRGECDPAAGNCRAPNAVGSSPGTTDVDTRITPERWQDLQIRREFAYRLMKTFRAGRYGAGLLIESGEDVTGTADDEWCFEIWANKGWPDSLKDRDEASNRARAEASREIPLHCDEIQAVAEVLLDRDDHTVGPALLKEILAPWRVPNLQLP